MRSKARFEKRVKLVGLVLVIGILCYALGYDNGQTSVYKKAENDHKLLQMYTGGNGK